VRLSCVFYSKLTYFLTYKEQRKLYSVVTPVFLLWLLNSTSNFVTLFVLVLHVFSIYRPLDRCQEEERRPKATRLRGLVYTDRASARLSLKRLPICVTPYHCCALRQISDASKSVSSLLRRLSARRCPHLLLRSTQPRILPGSLNRVPALAGVKPGMSPLSGGR